MSIVVSRGKGKGSSYSFSFGTLSAKLTDEQKNMTIVQIAEALMNQSDVIDGEIEIESVEFNIYKARQK